MKPPEKAVKGSAKNQHYPKYQKQTGILAEDTPMYYAHALYSSKTTSSTGDIGERGEGGKILDISHQRMPGGEWMPVMQLAMDNEWHQWIPIETHLEWYLQPPKLTRHGRDQKQSFTKKELNQEFKIPQGEQRKKRKDASKADQLFEYTEKPEENEKNKGNDGDEKDESDEKENGNEKDRKSKRFEAFITTKLIHQLHQGSFIHQHTIPNCKNSQCQKHVGYECLKCHRCEACAWNIECFAEYAIVVFWVADVNKLGTIQPSGKKTILSEWQVIVKLVQATTPEIIEELAVEYGAQAVTKIVPVRQIPNLPAVRAWLYGLVNELISTNQDQSLPEEEDVDKKNMPRWQQELQTRNHLSGVLQLKKPCREGTQDKRELSLQPIYGEMQPYLGAFTQKGSNYKDVCRIITEIAKVMESVKKRCELLYKHQSHKNSKLRGIPYNARRTKPNKTEIETEIDTTIDTTIDTNIDTDGQNRIQLDNPQYWLQIYSNGSHRTDYKQLTSIQDQTLKRTTKKIRETWKQWMQQGDRLKPAQEATPQIYVAGNIIAIKGNWVILQEVTLNRRIGVETGGSMSVLENPGDSQQNCRAEKKHATKTDYEPKESEAGEDAGKNNKEHAEEYTEKHIKEHAEKYTEKDTEEFPPTAEQFCGNTQMDTYIERENSNHITARFTEFKLTDLIGWKILNLSELSS